MGLRKRERWQQKYCESGRDLKEDLEEERAGGGVRVSESEWRDGEEQWKERSLKVW
jgi:hypothetical protein